MNVSFLERLTAYLIDSIILVFLLAIITSPIKVNDDSEEKLKELSSKLTSGEITNDEYLKEYKNLYYDIQKENVTTNTISFLLTIAYFIGFNYLNKGQTIGKKILKIKVVGKNNETVKLSQVIIRSIFIYSLISSFISIIAIYILGKNPYYILTTIFSSIDTIFIIVTMFFILYRKDKLGLHDIIAKTKVVKENN